MVSARTIPVTEKKDGRKIQIIARSFLYSSSGIVK